jgi:type IV pilus assembly protein PilA
MTKLRSSKGFTLIEILVVIGIIAILAGIVIVALNPARQFAQARDTQRWSNVNTILNAIGQRSADNKGIFESGTGCNAGSIPTTTPLIMRSLGGYNIYDCIVPIYVSTMPLDPVSGTGTSSANYVSGYSIIKDAVTGRITVGAVGEITIDIGVTR